MGKKKNPYTVNLDDETAQVLEALARATQRKARELLRLLVVPVIFETWIKYNQEQPENKAHEFTPAHFKGDLKK